MPKVRLVAKSDVTLNIWFILGLKLVHTRKNITHCLHLVFAIKKKKIINLPATGPDYVVFS